MSEQLQKDTGRAEMFLNQAIKVANLEDDLAETKQARDQAHAEVMSAAIAEDPKLAAVKAKAIADADDTVIECNQRIVEVESDLRMNKVFRDHAHTLLSLHKARIYARDIAVLTPEKEEEKVSLLGRIWRPGG